MQNLTSTNYDIETKQSGVTVVDFWAAWCGPCRMMNPVLEELDSEGQVKVYKVNVDEQQQLASQHQIQSIPTILVYKDGVEQGEIVGAMPLTQLKEYINKLTS